VTTLIPCLARIRKAEINVPMEVHVHIGVRRGNIRRIPAMALAVLQHQQRQRMHLRLTVRTAAPGEDEVSEGHLSLLSRMGVPKRRLWHWTRTYQSSRQKTTLL